MSTEEILLFWENAQSNQRDLFKLNIAVISIYDMAAKCKDSVNNYQGRNLDDIKKELLANLTLKASEIKEFLEKD